MATPLHHHLKLNGATSRTGRPLFWVLSLFLQTQLLQFTSLAKPYPDFLTLLSPYELSGLHIENVLDIECQAILMSCSIAPNLPISYRVRQSSAKYPTPPLLIFHHTWPKHTYILYKTGEWMTTATFCLTFYLNKTFSLRSLFVINISLLIFIRRFFILFILCCHFSYFINIYFCNCNKKNCGQHPLCYISSELFFIYLMRVYIISVENGTGVGRFRIGYVTLGRYFLLEFSYITEQM